MKIEKFESFNPRIKKRSPSPYQLHVKYSHGDADFDSFETFNFQDKSKFDNVSHFFYDIMNFKPNCAAGNLGYFYPLPDMVNSGTKQSVIDDRLNKIAQKWGVGDLYEYVISDDHYNSGYASIEGVKCTIDGQPKAFVFKEAIETNRVSLPNIGDIISVTPDNIPGYGPSIFGGTWGDYLPNSGSKDYKVDAFKAKVLDCSINFYHDDEDNEYYMNYTDFHYILLLETNEDVLKHPLSGKITKLVLQISGYDPEFESKFKKEKYDGLNYYEI